MNNRLVLLEFSWVDSLCGHSYEYDRNVVTAFLARGWECVIYAHRACRLKLLGGAEIKPIFSYGATDSLVRCKLLRPFVKFYAHTTRTVKEVRDVVLAEDAPHTVFFVQYAEQFQIWALYLAISKPLLGRLVIMLRVTSLQEVNGVARATWRTPLYRIALLCLCRLGSRVELVTDSDFLQKEYQALTSAQINLVPHPNPGPLITNKVRRHSSLCITAVGRLATQKGSHYLPQIMAAVHGKGLSAHFVIHATMDSLETSQLYKPLLDSIRGNARNTDMLIEKPLCTEEYWRQLGAADVVLLLYDPSRYRNQISGVFMDALAAGCYPIVSDGTWMAHIVRTTGFGAVTRLDGNINDSVIGILEADIPNNIPQKVREFLNFHTRDNFFSVITSILQLNSVE